MAYVAPQQDLLFCLRALADVDRLASLPALDGTGMDTAAAVIEQGARFVEEVVAPLNSVGDRQPPRWEDGRVHTTPGFAAAFRSFAEGGWQGLSHPAEFGGQALPNTIAAACAEMLHAANLSFALCPLLTDGAIEALMVGGTDEQRARFLPRLISGEWTGTMVLTEPQAGSDLALVRTRAEPIADGPHAGGWRLFGTKIFITWGEHDMADNIVHFVLARIAGAPDGVKGISLFAVPKVLPDGTRNDVHCLGIEHKLGIRASPTAVLQFGGDTGAVGELVGEENRGLALMFVMMNAARYAVGLQGVAVAERAYQQALAYARDRVQSRPVDGSTPGSATLVHHPDVRRMLMTMRSQIEAFRALAIAAAAAHDEALHHPDEAVRADRQAEYEFMVPLVKGCATEMSLEVTSLAIQVHGGMGFIEETGAAQHYRDARILPIYEGTTAIQANDLVSRKTLRDGGETARRIALQVTATVEALRATDSPEAAVLARRIDAARAGFLEIVDFMRDRATADVNAAYAGSVPYLLLAGHVLAGWQMGRAFLAARADLDRGVGDAAFLDAKLVTARFFGDHLLARCAAWRQAILEGADSLLAIAPDAW